MAKEDGCCGMRAGETYVVGFERGAAVFGIDSKAKAIVRPEPRTKLHQMRFLPRIAEAQASRVLAVSTEDGRILFFDTNVSSEESTAQQLPSCPCAAQLGGSTAGVSGRIKDFEILQLPRTENDSDFPLLVVTGNSDSVVRLWTVFASELMAFSNLGEDQGIDVNGNGTESDISKAAKQIGNLVDTMETGSRITCLGAFVMDGKLDGNDAPADEQDRTVAGAEEDEDESESDDEESE